MPSNDYDSKINDTGPVVVKLFWYKHTDRQPLTKKALYLQARKFTIFRVTFKYAYMFYFSLKEEPFTKLGRRLARS